jgi:hypothetical protein
MDAAQITHILDSYNLGFSSVELFNNKMLVSNLGVREYYYAGGDVLSEQVYLVRTPDGERIGTMNPGKSFPVIEFFMSFELIEFIEETLFKGDAVDYLTEKAKNFSC